MTQMSLFLSLKYKSNKENEKNNYQIYSTIITNIRSKVNQ